MRERLKKLLVALCTGADIHSALVGFLRYGV
jgi:hypothetical protein